MESLLVADKTGYFAVYRRSGRPKPYHSEVRRGGKLVHLGSFVTAEEAALCFARSPEGQAAAAKRATAVVPLTSEEARQQARAEELTLRVAETKTGYFGVHHKFGKPKPYTAQVRCGSKMVYLGSFVTAEEAALFVARSPEGQAVAMAGAKRAAAPPPLTSEEAQKQAQAEGLTLRVSDNQTGYFGVHYDKLGKQAKPYLTQVRLGGKRVALGRFATAEEAALCVARSPEGQAAAKRAAPPLIGEEARQQAQAGGLTLRVADNKTGYYGVYWHPSKSKPFAAQVRCEGERVTLGYFVTAEEAALCVARSPEGQAAAQKAAETPPPLASDVVGGDDAGDEDPGEEEGEEEIQVLDAVEVLGA